MDSRSFFKYSSSEVSSGFVVMTPSQQAKAAGLKSLSQVSALTGQSLQTLSNWAKDKPELFRIVLLGCKADLDT